MLQHEVNKVVKFRAKGTAFEALREYVRGDVYKDINWKATARSNKLIVNQYEPEQNQRAYAIIDTGRAMSYKIHGKSKLDTAIETALVLNEIVANAGDMFGCATFDLGLNDYVKPGKGTTQRNAIMECMYHSFLNKNASDFQKSFTEFAEKEKA